MNYYLYFGKSKIDLTIFNVIVTKGGLFNRDFFDCKYSLKDLLNIESNN